MNDGRDLLQTMNTFIFCVELESDGRENNPRPRILFGTIQARDGRKCREQLDEYLTGQGLTTIVLRKDIRGIISKSFQAEML